MGWSRSATVVAAYLMSKKGRLTSYQTQFAPQTNKLYLHTLWGARSAQSLCFVKHFLHVPPVVGLILQLMCNPIDNQNLGMRKKQNITTERMPQIVLNNESCLENAWKPTKGQFFAVRGPL